MGVLTESVRGLPAVLRAVRHRHQNSIRTALIRWHLLAIDDHLRGYAFVDLAFHRGLGSVYEYFRAGGVAEGRGQLAGEIANLRGHQTVRRLELFNIAVFRKALRPLHELGPDGQRRMRAFQIQIAIVVEPYPYYAQQLGCETGEPAVTGGSGLARGWRRESMAAHRCRDSTAHLFLQPTDH